MRSQLLWTAIVALFLSRFEVLGFSNNHIITTSSRYSTKSDQFIRSSKDSFLRIQASSNINAVSYPVSQKKPYGKIRSGLIRTMMLTYILSMCIALPVTLAPPALLHKAKIIEKTQREHLSARTGQFCARWLLRIIPFAKVTVTTSDDNPEHDPSIWVCNHTSMLDIFFLMATSKELRGKKARPIKIIYWKPLENNPVNKIFFRSCGFIPVEMAANKPGEANEYDRKSFKQVLKSCKQAFEDGFDIGIIPEGQLNPNPEKGLLPVFPGAFTLAKMSKRPIRMIALHGLHRLWHPNELIGMPCTDRNIKVRAYPKGKGFESSDDFKEKFTKIVGHFGGKGEDLPVRELNELLYGAEGNNENEDDDFEAWLSTLSA